MTEVHPTVARRFFRGAAEIVVGIYLVLDSLISPLFGPPMRWLSSLRPVQHLEHRIAGLPPYAILVLLVVPFGFAELAKVYAVLLMAEDHLRMGMTIFIGAYVVSILVCERTFQAGKAQLLTISWFATLFGWAMMIKARVMTWFRQTAVWRATGEMRGSVALTFRRVRARLQTALGMKSRRSFEQR